MTAKDIYPYANPDSGEMICDLLDRFGKINTFARSCGLMSRWTKAFNAYYGLYYSDPKTIYGMGTGGSQGELTLVSVNTYRNLLQHILVLVTQNKLSFDAIPFNSDVEGRNAGIVANSLLEYLFEQPKYAQEVYRMLEMGLILGTSFLVSEWELDRKFAGVDGNMEPVYSGEPVLRAYTPMEIVVEPFLDNFNDQQWFCTKKAVNRYDLIAQYPELKQEILNLDKIRDIQTADPYFIANEDHVWKYKFFHKSSKALKFGRYTEFCGSETVLMDTFQNPYCDTDPVTGAPVLGTGIPATCFRPAITYGSAFGYSVAFDLLPLQDEKNMLASTIATNQAVFGVQNIMVARGTNFDFADVGNGLRVLEYDINPDLGPGMGAPAILELLKTPPEIFNHYEKIDQEMESLAGINGALRGTPPQQVSSGTAMALLTTQAQSFNLQIENVYTACAEETALKLLKVIAKFMPQIDIVSVVGLSEKAAIASFKAEELAKIQKIKVLTGNALSKSPSGRLAMAQDMIGSGQLTPAEYVEVAQTGALKNKTEIITAEEALIQWENQQLMQGTSVPVLQTDNHTKHIKDHLSILMRPEIRNNPSMQAVTMKHIVAHQQDWVVLGVQNPQLLALVTGSPIPPDPPAPGVVGAPPGNSPQPPHALPPGAPQQHPAHTPVVMGQQTDRPNPGGIGVNNMANASSIGGQSDLAASALRSASHLLTKGRK